MSESADYPYAAGDLLTNRHTYQYTPYMGLPLLRGWRKNRAAAKAECGSPVQPPAAVDDGVTGPPYRPAEILEHLLAAVSVGDVRVPPVRESLAMWVKKFEVSKRLYEAYDADLKPIDRETFRNLAVYLRFAETVESAYRTSGELPYLNVLLKVMDTLIACRAELDTFQKGRLARLIACEDEHVATLATRCGVRL